VNKNKGIKLVFVQKITFFSTKTAATRAALFDFNMHEIVSRLGLRPRPMGSLQCPRPLAVFRGPTSKGMGGRRGNGKGRREEGWRGQEGREGEDMGEDGRRKGEGGVRPLPYEEKKEKSAPMY